MNEVKVVLKKKDGSGLVEIFVNDQKINGIKEFDLKFNGSTIEFQGIRFKTDRSGQFYVDEKNETANEPINLLLYLEDNYINFEIVNSFKKAIDWELHNIYMTSMHNAYKFLDEEGIKKWGN